MLIEFKIQVDGVAGAAAVSAQANVANPNLPAYKQLPGAFVTVGPPIPLLGSGPPIPPLGSGPPIPPLGSGSPTSTFPMQYQEKPNWCWAAVAVSIDHYFRPSSTKEWNQQSVAEKVLKVHTATEADQTGSLPDALNFLKIPNTPQLGDLSFADIQQQLDKNLPVCVHIEWNGGGGEHFVVISGYDASPGRDPQVYVSDPNFKDSNPVSWDYNWFVWAYGYAPGGEGVWADTVLVLPPREEDNHERN